MEINKSTIRRIFLGVAGCIVLYWLLHETSRVISVFNWILNMLSPFIVGAAIAFVLNVPMRAIEGLLTKIPSHGLRRALSLVLTIVAVLLLLFGVFYLLIPQIGETVESLIRQLPEFFEQVQQKVMDFLQKNPDIQEWLGNYTDFNSIDWASLFQSAITLITESIGGVVDKAVNMVISLGTGIFNAFLSIVFAIYCLVRKEILARQGRRLLYAILPEKTCDKIIRVLRMTNRTFSKFISGQCLEAVILGTMFAVSMAIFGMPFIPLISVIITVTALVPIVGAFAGCIIGAFFILVVDPVLAFWFIILFLVLQQIEGNLIYPKVVGTSIGLPGMWVLVAVTVGGEIMGIMGMLVMIPVVSVCYTLLREFTNKRVERRQIDPDKLMDHPPELKNQFKENRERREHIKFRREMRKLAENYKAQKKEKK